MKTSTTHLIRPLVEADIGPVVRLWHDTWHENLPGLKHPHALPQWEERFRTQVLPGCRVWVVEVGRAPAGFMALDVARGRLDQLFIATRFQRRGLGSLLLQKARALCPGGLSLHTLVENNKARRFYEKQGFRRIAAGVNPIHGQPNLEYHWATADHPQTATGHASTDAP